MMLIFPSLALQYSEWLQMIQIGIFQDGFVIIQPRNLGNPAAFAVAKLKREGFLAKQGKAPRQIDNLIQCSNRRITPLGVALRSKHPLPQPYGGKELPKLLQYILFNVCNPCKMKISEFDKFCKNTHKQAQDLQDFLHTPHLHGPTCYHFYRLYGGGVIRGKKNNSIACFLSTQTLSYIHNSRRHDRQDEVEPDVGEDAPEGGDEEHPEVFDLAALSVGNGPHAYPDDYKHVEGGAADDGPWPQLAGLKFMTAHLE